MSAHNTALRMAQNLLRKRALAFPEKEVAYHTYATDPRASAYIEAAAELEVLILPEDDE